MTAAATDQRVDTRPSGRRTAGASAGSPSLVLDRTPPRLAERPVLDDDQTRVVAHRRGPLLVLAGPGTGKTTTLVEAMVERLGGPDSLAPHQVLGLTFGRRAAQEWRDRVTARIGGGGAPTVSTFHSFSYALVRQWSDPEAYVEPLRLLSGPEQELRLREVLGNSVADGRLDWPAGLAAALGTRGLATEVRAVVAKARALGLDPADLESLAAGAGELGMAWRAVGQFLGEYLDVLDAEGVADYTEVVHRAALLAHRPDVQRELRSRYRAVFVDEYQDTDPAQVRLLAGLVAPDAQLVVVGDPDQAIYAFRGADPAGILTFRESFRAPDGAPAPVVVLRATRRFGAGIGEAAQRVLRGTPVPHLPADVVRAHRSPVFDGGRHGDGVVDVLTFDSVSAEAAHVADVLRRAHLEGGLRWDQMAVLVRSGRRSVPGLRRSLAAAGVPVEVAGDELPLREEPAVEPLLALLRAAVDPAVLDDATVHRLLLSPLADSDPAELRRLGRALRARERAADPAARPTPSATLVRRLVEEVATDPAAAVLPLSTSSSGPDARARRALESVVRLGRLLHDARAAVARSASAEEVLWAVWSGAARGSGWPQRLEAAALRGGEAGRRADADLDAVLALFAAAQRVEERYAGRRGVENFLAELEGQEIPADTLAERGLRGPAVRILTAHRAKGLQWRLVVVASVQDGLWPDLRRRGSLLQADRLEVDGLVPPPPPAALLAEERRLFYVACTRAEERLVVTAVRSPLDDGEQPSRFVDELLAGRGDGIGALPAHRAGRPPRPLSVPGLVARLRAVAVDPDRPAALRAAAVRRLSVLAHATGEDGRALVPAAHPDRWWGLLEPTSSLVPVRPDDRPLDLSGSQLSALVACPLRWFLDHEVKAKSARTTALGFGSLVHALADAVAREELPADPDALDARIDQVWAELGFEALWQSQAERVAAGEAVRRFLHWHTSREGRRLLASELGFEVTVPLGEHGVRLRGSFDRVEVDSDGAVHVADLKTQKQALPQADLPQHPQLGVYQLAVREGALDDVPAEARARAGLDPDGRPPVAGAELVLLRVAHGDGPRVQEQPALGDGETWVEAALADADTAVRAERFPARPGPASCLGCDLRPACPAYDEGREVLP